MLNKIWAGLIILSILLAFGQDIADEVLNRHQNGLPLSFPYTISQTSKQHLNLLYHQYTIESKLQTDNTVKLLLHNNSPDELLSLAKITGNPKFITALITQRTDSHIQLLLPERHWQKMRAIMDSAFTMAKFAAKLALGLIGIMALWLGLMRIAELSGLIHYIIKPFQPLLAWLFPGIPRNHPAFASISMNMAANILGLGNSATPLGIKAMQQLQTLNQKKDTASHEMCMFLALNTSSVQLLPPVTLIALMGTGTAELIIPIILATSCSTVAAVIVAKLYARTGRKI